MVLMSYFVYKIVRKFIGYKWALAAWIVYSIFFALSPWTVIFYSDSVGLFFPTTSFYIYMHETKSRKVEIWKWSLLGLLSALAYKCKPQTFIMGIALCIVSLLGKEGRLAEKIKKIACYAVIFFLVLKACDVQANMLNLEIDREKSFGTAHYLMLGMIRYERNMVGRGL